MKQAYKYSLYTLLVLTIAAWVVHFLSPVYYSITISNIRFEQLGKIESGDGVYVSMHLPVSAIQYNMDGNELQLGQDRYDIVSISVKGDSAQCVLLYDSKETHLNKHLVRYTRSSRRSSDNTKRIVLWAPAYFQQSSASYFYNFHDNTIAVYPLRHNNLILNGFLQNILQPPDIA